jgi:hypothetical protein
MANVTSKHSTTVSQSTLPPTRPTTTRNPISFISFGETFHKKTPKISYPVHQCALSSLSSRYSPAAAGSLHRPTVEATPILHDMYTLNPIPSPPP